MSAPFTDKLVRAAIKTRIAAASGSTKVYPYNCLNFRLDPKTGKPDFSDWVGLFRNGDANGKTHGWVIRRISRLTEIHEGYEQPDFIYEVIGCYGFDPEGNETANSDDEFGLIVDAVSEEFNVGDQTILVNGKIAEHSGLHFPVLTAIHAGEKLLHFAGGKIEITEAFY